MSLCTARETLSVNLLTEIARCTGERIFIFWDDAADKPFEIEQLVSESMRKGLRLTVFTAERANAWNMACGNLDRLLTGDYVLRYLSHEEVERLVRLLDEHGCLGKRLSAMSMEDRIKEFEVRAGRQILVALHEATLGPPFEEILLNEFSEIQPEQARRLYLTICVLNRLNVQVRAGLIARVHGVPFSEFRDKFFGPLEHVVLAHKNDNIGDYLYRARHPEIAQIVFQQVLKEPTDRFNEYVRLLRDLNLAYASDETAFRELTRARNLHQLFPNHEEASALFAVATERSPDDPYLLQQRANYERLRPNGNLSLALELLSNAREKAPRDHSIVHTLGETLRAQSLGADTPIKRERFRKEARAVLSNLLRDQDVGQEAFPRHTLVKLAIDDVRDVLADTNSPERLVDETIREAERTLLESTQRCPNEELFLQAEAELGKLIGDDSRAFHAMEKAFRKNPRDPYIACRLASIYESKRDPPRALETIRSALDSNRGDKTLNFMYARLLRDVEPENQSVLLYHFRRGFVKWDNNYEAQFWFARYAFEQGNRDDISESKEVFRKLREVPMHHNRRVAIRDRLTRNSQPTRFTGTITRREVQLGYVARDGQGDWIFFHSADHDDSVWQRLKIHGRVSFEIGFSFAGVRALDLRS